MKKQSAKNIAVQTLKVWQTIKMKYPETIILVRAGKDYITFKDDAVIVNQKAPIEIITNKEKEQQCRFPFYKFDSILSILVRAGHRVAACDQLE